MMAEEFHELGSAEPLSGVPDLTIPRAKALYEAVRRNRDYVLLSLSRLPRNDGGCVECLTVEVTCDGIPKNNSYGLQYRERLVLVVNGDQKSIPSVFAMRVGFPRLAHQNRVAPDSPAQLCLYFEPHAAVLRTWTPEIFLRRIQWWFEKNARDELHLADQPLDHLFFSSKYELVLPWNFDALRAVDPEFVIARGEARSDGGMTWFLIPKVRASSLGVTTAVLIDLILTPVVNGAVEIDSWTLGELSDMLEARGAQLLPTLLEKQRELVDEHGAPTRTDKPSTVILLHVPICREPGGVPEKASHRAFVLLNDPLELGVATGALMRVDGKFYNAIGVMQSSEETEWRSQRVMPMDVLVENTPEAARVQSGITDAGPTGVVVGAGAVGSALLNLWGRSGWGKWTVIDKDHVKPHNLSRHTATADEIGNSKAQAVAALQTLATHGANEFAAITADASDASFAPVATVLRDAQLVVDVSANLEYPRFVSGVDHYARHASVFITPDGNAGVALVEDASRHQRLRTLEAQYYRAMIEEDWGHRHLNGNLSAFWSGASCRDISMVMPYARVMGHTSTFAASIPRLVSTDQASIRIWQCDERDALLVHDVLPQLERRMSLGDLDVFLDAGLENRLRALRVAAFPNETGGVLLGYYDFNIKALVLVAGLPAPPDSKSTPGSFERGIEGLKAAVEEAARRTAGIVGYVGEWHSHPPGCSATPSHHDWFQLIHLALGMGDDGLPGVQLIVGERDLQLLNGSVQT